MCLFRQGSTCDVQSTSARGIYKEPRTCAPCWRWSTAVYKQAPAACGWNGTVSHAATGATIAQVQLHRRSHALPMQLGACAPEQDPCGPEPTGHPRPCGCSAPSAAHAYETSGDTERHCVGRRRSCREACSQGQLVGRGIGVPGLVAAAGRQAGAHQRQDGTAAPAGKQAGRGAPAGRAARSTRPCRARCWSGAGATSGPPPAKRKIKAATIPAMHSNVAAALTGIRHAQFPAELTFLSCRVMLRWCTESVAPGALSPPRILTATARVDACTAAVLREAACACRTANQS